jgi:hypothetical protein
MQNLVCKNIALQQKKIKTFLKIKYKQYYIHKKKKNQPYNKGANKLKYQTSENPKTITI